MISLELQQFIPDTCPHCQNTLIFDGIHLYCQNDACQGRISRKLGAASGMLDLKGIAGKTLEPFAKDFSNMFELFKWARTEAVCISGNIDKYGIKYGSRSHEIFVNAFKNIRSLKYYQVILMMGYDGVGKKLAEQVAKEYCGLVPNYTSMEKALVSQLKQPNIVSYIKNAISDLESLGVIVDKPNAEAKENTKTIYICLTGSPKDYGWKTKEEFLAVLPNVEEVSLSDSRCSFLVTDSLDSTSGKMKAAKKKGIQIVTYSQFSKIVNS
jgi:NAD-dependent DNA ligase